MSEEEKKHLPPRSTRGQRMSKLIEEEIEQDNQFYSQIFGDESDEKDKEDFIIEQEQEDIFDSDFDQPEEQPLELGQEPQEEKKKKKNVYLDPRKRANNTSRKSSSKRERANSSKSSNKTSSSVDSGDHGDSISEEGNPALKKQKVSTRKSERTSTKQVSERIAQQSQEPHVDNKKVSQRKKSVSNMKQLSQEELMKEAEETAIINRESLLGLIKMEEEKKQKARQSATTKITGPKITRLSRNGMNTFIFSDFPSIPYCINSVEDGKLQTVMNNKKYCILTGNIARYVDPLTKIPYSNIEAFKNIRERFEIFKRDYGQYALNPTCTDPNFLKNFSLYLQEFVKLQHQQNISKQLEIGVEKPIMVESKKE